MNAYDTMAIVIADCPTCNAPAGEECINNSGNRSRSTHWQRKQAVQEWRKADHQELYRQFRREVLDRIAMIGSPEYGMSGC